jgi:hypothetical protein
MAKGGGQQAGRRASLQWVQSAESPLVGGRAGGRAGGQASGQAYGRAGAEAHLKPRFKLGVLEPLIDPPLEQLRIEEELRLLEQRLDKLGDGPRAAPRLLDDDHVAAAAMVRPKRVGNRL